MTALPFASFGVWVGRFAGSFSQAASLKITLCLLGKKDRSSSFSEPSKLPACSFPT